MVNDSQVRKRLKNKSLLIINQTRIQNLDSIPGKGFYESLVWANYFKKVIFICFSATKNFMYKKIKSNYYLLAVPFDLSDSIVKTVIDIAKNYWNLIKISVYLIKKGNIDLIRSENIIITGLPSFLISKITNRPYLIWLGGFERKALMNKYNNNISVKFLKKIIIILEHLILGNSNFVFSLSDEIHGLVKKRKVINSILTPNFIDLSLYKKRTNSNLKNKEKIKFLYSGRLSREKGILVLLDAIKQISSKYENFELDIVGDGYLKRKIVEFIDQNNLQTKIHLLGTFGFFDMPKIYFNADVFVLPSYTEGTSASLIESMGSGCAPLCTNVGMNYKLVQNEVNGIIIVPGNSTLLANKIAYYLENQENISKFGELSRKKIEEYSNKFLELHSIIYKNTIIMSKKKR